MQEVFGNRKISIARELTKTYEEIIDSEFSTIQANKNNKVSPRSHG